MEKMQTNLHFYCL